MDVDPTVELAKLREQLLQTAQENADLRLTFEAQLAHATAAAAAAAALTPPAAHHQDTALRHPAGSMARGGTPPRPGASSPRPSPTT